MPRKILFIQTAFIGDAILISSQLESWHRAHPEDELYLLVRQGNESLYADHPFLSGLLVWKKKEGKYRQLIRVLKQIRKHHFDVVVNFQRFGSTGFLTAFSKGKEKVGFDKNPFSWSFTRKKKHEFAEGIHETQRNQLLIEDFCGPNAERPRLYPSQTQYSKVAVLQGEKYICAAPTSVWFTKQFHPDRWVELFDQLDPSWKVYLLGAPQDHAVCQDILIRTTHERARNLAGELGLLESAALMEKASFNLVNDSAPMHLCSAMNAVTRVFYCSTIPEFGFGPLAEDSRIIQEGTGLECRPCGIHGFEECPLGHFRCCWNVELDSLVKELNQGLQ